MDTSGFYKLDHDSNELLYAPNAVYAPTFTLLKESHAAHEYPQDGWYWFDSEEDARAGIVLIFDTGVMSKTYLSKKRQQT